MEMGEPKLSLTSANTNAEMRGILQLDKTCLVVLYRVSYLISIIKVMCLTCLGCLILTCQKISLANLHEHAVSASAPPPSSYKFWAVCNGIPHGWVGASARSIVARRDSSTDFEHAEFARSKSAKITIWLTNWQFKTFLEVDVNSVLLLIYPNGLNGVGVAWG